MLIKKFLILSSVIIIFFVIAGCSGGQTAEPGQSEPGLTSGSGNAETELTADLPEETYDGYIFRIWCRESERNMYYSSDLWSEELTGEKLNDAVYERCSAVASRFDIVINALFTGGDTLGNSTLKTIAAGDDAYDIINVYGRSIWAFISSDAVLEWKELSWIDLDQPWWNRNSVENFAVGGKIFCALGDISYHTIGSAFAMAFNKNLFDQNNIKYPYDDITRGQWTFDTFADIVKQGTNDLNGDGMIDLSDRHGWLAHEWVAPINYIYSTGTKICEMDENNIPQISLDTEAVSNATEAYRTLIQTADVRIDFNKFTDFQTAFIADRVFFIDTTLLGIDVYRDMDSDYGIIPQPKFSESTEGYASNVDAGMNVILVPVTSADPSRTGAVVEVFAFYGYRDVTSVYYDSVLSYKYARDESSVAMLDIIRDSLVFDFGYWGGSPTFQNIGQDLLIKGKEPASHIAGKLDAAKTELAKFVSSINDAG